MKVDIELNVFINGRSKPINIKKSINISKSLKKTDLHQALSNKAEKIQVELLKKGLSIKSWVKNGNEGKECFYVDCYPPSTINLIQLIFPLDKE